MRYRGGKTYSSHQPRSACIVEEFDFFGSVAGVGVGEGNAYPIEARADGFSDLVVHFGKPWLAVVRVGYGTSKLVRMFRTYEEKWRVHTRSTCGLLLQG
jgi:hypothetical protein